MLKQLYPQKQYGALAVAIAVFALAGYVKVVVIVTGTYGKYGKYNDGFLGVVAIIVGIFALLLLEEYKFGYIFFLIIEFLGAFLVYGGLVLLDVYQGATEFGVIVYYLVLLVYAYKKVKAQQRKCQVGIFCCDCKKKSKEACRHGCECEFCKMP